IAVGKNTEHQLKTVEYLISIGVNINAQHSDFKGVFALQEVRPSCICGNVNCNPEVLKRLIQLGAFVTITTTDFRGLSICAPVVSKLKQVLRQTIFERQFDICKKEHPVSRQRPDGFKTTREHFVLCEECTTKVYACGLGNSLAIPVREPTRPVAHVRYRHWPAAAARKAGAGIWNRIK
ncbi:hypothetical protein T484DRAFT_1758540, partial [Baffinella frigidus]